METQEIMSVAENEIVFHSKVAGVANWKCGAQHYAWNTVSEWCAAIS